MFEDDYLDLDMKVIVDKIKNSVLSELERKVDKTDFNQFLGSKTSKKEHEMALSMISQLHQQLKQTVVLMSSHYKTAYNTDNINETTNQRKTNLAQLS